MTSIYLSPHQDDAGFSLGSFINKRGSGYLVNIFNVTNFLPNPPTGLSKEDLVQFATNIRDIEDHAFADKCGLKRINLNLMDACIHHKNPFDHKDIESESKKVIHALLNCFAGINELNQNTKSNLYCPMGIGGHRNHLSTFAAVSSQYSKLKNSFNIYFYEDLPYACDSPQRARGIQRLQNSIKECQWERVENYLNPSEQAIKQELISCYRSQIDIYSKFSSSSANASFLSYPLESLWIPVVK